jgi:hypothetical protein
MVTGATRVRVQIQVPVELSIRSPDSAVTLSACCIMYNIIARNQLFRASMLHFM